MKLNICSILVLTLCLVAEATAQWQDYSAQLIDNRSQSITKKTLSSAETLYDLNRGFPADWISESDYISVVLSYGENGDTIQAIGQNHLLTKEQVVLIRDMPVGNTLEFAIDYLNTNSATREKSKRQIKFSRCLVPATTARYAMDHSTPDDYFQSTIIDKVLANPTTYNSTANEENGLPSVVAQFKIDEAGKPSDFIITHPSANEATNQLVKEAVLAMPPWQPAEQDGVVVKQLFTLMVGNMFGC